ncbi:MAG TPA: ribonuclease III [Spartobacteria bacterium]|nr:ribonuclease III [Spartobacteria bacterium]HCP91505.1 ribonuclease III [Spartobacteria bacterium]
MHPLEERIGYKFRNSLLLAEALTHPSLGHETQQHHFNNQRLEFLGDAILQLVITEYLFRHFSGEPEGQLTKLRSRLVSRGALKAHAAALDLGRYLLMGRGEEASGGRARTSTLADAFEALIGAIYLDGNLENARKFILAQAQPDLEQLAEEPVDFNPKGNLQELLQSISSNIPVYELVSQSGPEHAKTFVVDVLWEGMPLGQGRGNSKKEAETAAAEEAMKSRRWEKRTKGSRSKRKIDKSDTENQPRDSLGK